MTTINTINTINNIHDIINELSKYEINLVHKIYSIVIWDYMYDIIIDSINTKIKDIKNGFRLKQRRILSIRMSRISNFSLLLVKNCLRSNYHGCYRYTWWLGLDF